MWPLESGTHTTFWVSVSHARGPVARRRISYTSASAVSDGLGLVGSSWYQQAERGAPHGAIDRARSNAIERHVDATVLVGIERLVTLAVAIGVEDERSSTCDFTSSPVASARCPLSRRTTRARPQRVISASNPNYR